MKIIITTILTILLISCNSNISEDKSVYESEEISFIIDLKVNSNSTENLNQFVKEITENVIKTEDFCLEYGYYVSEDMTAVTLYEKYKNSDGATKHGQNFIEGPYFERFFNLFTLENFVVTGPAPKNLKNSHPILDL